MTVARLFLAMLGIQVSIGALNDAVDAPLDALAKPRKPIPAGVVDGRVATIVAGAGAVAGLGLSAMSGPATVLAGAGCLAMGWIYDLRLSRTALSWLPLAIALPLLPIHAWLGAAGQVPPSLVVLVPVGVLAGAGLALANGLVDIERDASTRRSALVVRLGRQRGWLVQTVLLAAAATLALLGAPDGSPNPALPGIELVRTLLAIRRWGVVLGCVALVVGAVVLASSRAEARERGWELEALGVVGLGVGWLAGTAALEAA
jgi:4-hydroxybenzoate polyprenyltransferase